MTLNAPVRTFMHADVGAYVRSLYKQAGAKINYARGTESNWCSSPRLAPTTALNRSEHDFCHKKRSEKLANPPGDASLG